MTVTLEFRVHRVAPWRSSPTPDEQQELGAPAMASSKWGLLRGDQLLLAAQHRPVCLPSCIPLPSPPAALGRDCPCHVSLVLSQTIASTVSKFKEESTPPFLWHFVIGRKIKYWLSVHKYGGLVLG